MSIYRTIDVEAELTHRFLDVDADLSSTLLGFDTTLTTEVYHNIVSDYNPLTNKPQINSVTLIGNKSLPEIGIDVITNTELEEILR